MSKCVFVLMFQYADVHVCEHINVLYKVISAIHILQILPLFLPKMLRNHAIFQTSKSIIPAAVPFGR